MQLRDKVASVFLYGMKRGVFGVWKSRAHREPASQRLPVKQPPQWEEVTQRTVLKGNEIFHLSLKRKTEHELLLSCRGEVSKKNSTGRWGGRWGGRWEKKWGEMLLSSMNAPTPVFYNFSLGAGLPASHCQERIPTSNHQIRLPKKHTPPPQRGKDRKPLFLSFVLKTHFLPQSKVVTVL